MVNELETKGLDDAVSAAVANAYEIMLSGYIEAAGDKAKEAAADTKFKTAVGLVRRTRIEANKQL